MTFFIYFRIIIIKINTKKKKPPPPPPPPSSKSVQKVSFSCFSDSLFGLICHYSPNSQKNLLFALIALLFISSCKDKKTDPVENKVTSIAVTPSSPRVVVGDKQQLTATVLPADAANKEVTWSSNDEKKATVDATGLVTGIDMGTAVITVAAKDGSNVKETVTITIAAAAKATSIVVTPSSPNVAVGLTQRLTATVSPADASKEVTWSSSNESKATVDAAGLVTGIGMGTAVITAAAKDGSDVKGTVTVNITVRATSVAITPADPSVGIRGNLTLTAAVLPAEAAQAVRWTSSHPGKATIDAGSGEATGIALGTTVITAVAADGSGIAGTVTLTVSDVTIALGAERFNVALPAAGGAVTLANAPRSIASDIRAVKVYITAAANAAIKMGSAAFTQGQPVDFTNPATFTITAQDGTAKSYTISIPSYNATGNPYGIYTVKHLVDVANGLTASYLLKNNIDLPNKDAADAAAATGISNYAYEGWRSLGSFTGTFDGGNFSINNFYIKNNPGLFRNLGTWGIIKNLGVNAVSGTVVKGGILAGSNLGTINKCYATGSVSYSSSESSESSVGGLVGNNEGHISNSYATGSVSSESSYVGGLVGSNRGSISNSYATGSVSSSSESSESSVGGLVGSNRGSISNSHATGSVSSSPSSSSYSSYSVGGLVGSNSNNSSISNSYATGSVSSESSESSYVGGLAGSNSGNSSISSISNSYATGSVSYSTSTSYSTTSVGGLVGSNSSIGSISNSYATGNVSSSATDVSAKVGG